MRKGNDYLLLRNLRITNIHNLKQIWVLLNCDTRQNISWFFYQTLQWRQAS